MGRQQETLLNSDEMWNPSRSDVWPWASARLPTHCAYAGTRRQQTVVTSSPDSKKVRSYSDSGKTLAERVNETVEASKRIFKMIQNPLSRNRDEVEAGRRERTDESKQMRADRRGVLPKVY